MKMHKHAETFHANKGYKLAILHPYFLYVFIWKLITSTCFSHDSTQMTTILVLDVRFSQRIRFLGGLFFLGSRVRVRVRARFLDYAIFDGRMYMRTWLVKSCIQLVCNTNHQTSFYIRGILPLSRLLQFL